MEIPDFKKSKNMSEAMEFTDIISANNNSSIFEIMTKEMKLQKTCVTDKHYSPQDIKDLVLKSVYLESVIDAECARTGERKEKLKQEIAKFVEEIGFDRKLCVIRWMGMVFLKISYMMKIGIYTHDPAIALLKATMGKNPVLFLPTHRSYADFCLMTYMCYHYDIEFPAVAAGMDFYSMAIVGKRMRETGAFYIRRTLVGAPLYAATLRQYVRTLVAKHCAPIEFFLEGTRSRSNKSLPPKYGMLSMSLAPYFAREVSDVTIVPININYDRLMEHSLFAFEHLGVPKPKESTGGLFKALRSLNDHFGNIYISLGTPLSVNEYLGEEKQKEQQSIETLKPVDLQHLTPEQFNQVQNLANYVITLQQSIIVVTISNLLACVLMQSVVSNTIFTINQVVLEVEWLMMSLKSLGATISENNVRDGVRRMLVVHSKMIKVDKDGGLRLISGALINVSDGVKKKMKGHILKAETMVNAVPVIQLQLYVNPLLHYLAPPAVVYLLVRRGTMCKEKLKADYQRCRKLLRHEFFHMERNEDDTLQRALDYCIENGAIVVEGTDLLEGQDTRLQSLLKHAINPALVTVIRCMEIMNQKTVCEYKQALKLIQERVESSHCHPYCLSLDCIANCMQGLHLVGALIKKRDQDVFYEVVSKVMAEYQELVTSILPTIEIDYPNTNSVMIDPNLTSRL